MQIIDTSFFINELYIPLASLGLSGSSSQATPNNNGVLNSLIVEVEEDVLLSALGLVNYNLLQNALIDLPNAGQIWKDLVNGKNYDSYRWEGLKNSKGCLAYAIYYTFLHQNSDQLTAVGVSKINTENAVNVSPFAKLANSWQKFTNKYQGGCLLNPITSISKGYSFIDWYGTQENVQRSLYQYLNDNAELYSFDVSKFQTFDDNVNSFGL
jgi:hypothetical protein